MALNAVALLNHESIQRLLDGGELRRLFVDELGWDNSQIQVDLKVGNETIHLTALAQKRDLVAFEYHVVKGAGFPNYVQRASIEAALAKSVREHLIIYIDNDRSSHVWQWAKREIGRPIQRREHAYQKGRRADLLIQKLSRIVFSLEAEEAGITIVDVAGRLKAAFDVEPITKRFYDGFQAQHDRFIKKISGVPDETTRRWYASIMLNRLMFVYFIQAKGFLNSDPLYLQTKLVESQAFRPNRFLEDFLFPLFFDCLAKHEDERPAAVGKRIGKVPFLNGGLFKMHQIEMANPGIEISDDAFAELFSFFNSWTWHLDERPISEGNEINPDVLGYIFERYINQEQMGAYYTKEDITEYIATFVILPHLVDLISNSAPGKKSANDLWQGLRDDPDRYIFPAMRHGLTQEFPSAVQDPNAVAPNSIALDAETWAEAADRRQRYIELRSQIVNGKIASVEQCLQENLNLRQLVQDTLERSSDPEFLDVAYSAVTEITVLDPACGSGAFLFAAMNILQPLYEACLDKMSVMLAGDNLSGNDELISKFGNIVTQSTEKHPNQSYFILKRIALANLYGVDIMEEAVEICKLRLFLKLISQVGHVEDVEPLPDIDFNIKSGNSLVGVSDRKSLAEVMGGRLDFDDALGMIEQRVADVAAQIGVFQKQQTLDDRDNHLAGDSKAEIQSALSSLNEDLNVFMAAQYSVNSRNAKKYALWKETHRPFHWYVEFFEVASQGGFSVVIGNPPWKPYTEVKDVYTVREYVTERTGNLYGLFVERGLAIRSASGAMSFIVQLPLGCSPKMLSARNLLRKKSKVLFVATFDDRPGKLFTGLENCRSVIFFSMGGEDADGYYATRYIRWKSAARAQMFERMHYTRVGVTPMYPDRFAKVQSQAVLECFAALRIRWKSSFKFFLAEKPTDDYVFYQESVRYWVKALVGLPYYTRNGVSYAPPHGRYLYCRSKDAAYVTCALLNSSLFYVYFVTFGDCFHLNDSMIDGFPVDEGVLADTKLIALGKALDVAVRNNAVTQKQVVKKTGDRLEYSRVIGRKSKGIVDQIDSRVAEMIGLTALQYSEIVDYDASFRVGGEDED